MIVDLTTTNIVLWGDDEGARDWRLHRTIRTGILVRYEGGVWEVIKMRRCKKLGSRIYDRLRITLKSLGSQETLTVISMIIPRLPGPPGMPIADSDIPALTTHGMMGF